ncbi:hypothetical protein SEUBUCD646_0C01650 [Saccharomyces eubayanus]|uniref:Hyphally-regulated cell wall protein N-terminal domain-containing protein n=1 Tax=Saccharomyces eubayanus TaxID=1080349 RepID=A0ABN8VSS9_SACEU|nr:hypothetical protein SEUBUCD650_0C01610 [Saccharomyces eubayanus]CAI1916884.1 hypothetical protein SEUBUCD646_0C01650 [Saccharomyces eubayanus]
MFSRLNKLQTALVLALYSQSALAQIYTNSSSSVAPSSSVSISSSISQSSSSGSGSGVSSTITPTSSGASSTITSSSSSGTGTTTSGSLSSSDGTIYLPATTISADVTLSGDVFATDAVEIAAGGKLTLLDGDKYGFSGDLRVYGGLFVAKSKATYLGSNFDISGSIFDVTGEFNAQEPAATSASVYSFTPGSFENSGDISLSLSESSKGQVTFSPYSNTGTFDFSNAVLNGGSASGLQRRAEATGSTNNGEINLDNGSTYVVVEPVSGKGTINIISGNLYLHYPDTFTGQTVDFKGEGVLAVDPTETNTTPIPVVGYTGKNQIAITADVTVSYDSATGVLTATKGNADFSFAIGTGFSSSGFSVSEGTFAGAAAFYLNYGGAVASSSVPSSVSSTSGASSTASGSVTSSSSGTTSETRSVYTTTLTSGEVTSTVVVSCSKTTDASGHIYTVTTTVPCTTTATITSCDDNGCHVVPAPTTTTATITSCDDNGCHVIPAPTTTTATITSCDENGCHVVPAPTATTTSPKSYTTFIVTHCEDNDCSVKTVTSEAPKETSTTTATSETPESHTTYTVTNCDDNGCDVKTVTSAAPKPTTATAVVTSGAPKGNTVITVITSGPSKGNIVTTVIASEAPNGSAATAIVTSGAPKVTSATATGSEASSSIIKYGSSASKSLTGIVVQSEGIAAGLKTNALNALVGIFIFAFL